VVNSWNSLPEDTVMAKTVNRFDGRVGKLLKSECYSELMDDDYCNVMIDAHKEFCFTL